MSKKTYRPGSTSTPRYPRLVDLNRQSMLEWGLVAVGTVWLGAAGCKARPAEGETLALLRGETVPAQFPRSQVIDASAPDASVAEKINRLIPLGGAIAPARQEGAVIDVLQGGGGDLEAALKDLEKGVGTSSASRGHKAKKVTKTIVPKAEKVDE